MTDKPWQLVQIVEPVKYREVPAFTTLTYPPTAREKYRDSCIHDLNISSNSEGRPQHEEVWWSDQGCMRPQ